MILLATQDGTVTVANAGHIAPYLNNAEVAVENGLPLGLVAEAAYPESTFHQQPDQQLTLVTDGVVEARSESGELYSFERTAQIAGQPAESIVAAAQEYGQEDDITVVTLTRLPIGESPMAPQAASVFATG
jgi:serine phosphatase RsbU (regulator of sigma subunit)